MRTGRRQFLSGLLAAGMIPAPSWADAGSPAYLSAAATPTGEFVLCGISADLEVVFEIPLPARGHAAAAHPVQQVSRWRRGQVSCAKRHSPWDAPCPAPGITT